MKTSSKKQEARLLAALHRLERGPVQEKDWRVFVDTWVIPHIRVAVGEAAENSLADLGQEDADCEARQHKKASHV